MTLGCARNDVDSEELAGRLGAQGWQVGSDTANADVVLINTCGFIAKAKQDSIDTVLAAAEHGAKVVAVGCLAERYGKELADSLPEAAAVLGFDDYPEIGARLTDVLEGRDVPANIPVDRRTLLPMAPAARGGVALAVPGHGLPHGADLGIAAADGPVPAHLRQVVRRRLEDGPVASLKLASGCDRRCAFCAIPSFRGAFVSRDPQDVLAEAEWLAGTGVRELVLVSENSTSYGKDLGDPRMLEALLPQLAAVSGIVRVRVSYLQPAETRPGLVEAIATTPGVAAYFDLSFQHSSEQLLRRMRRFGSTDQFIALLGSARRLAPQAGARSNVIVGFPGESRADVAELERFLTEARLDAVGVFDYSDEEGTEAAGMDRKVSAATIRRRYARIGALVEQLCAQRAADRIGTTVEVLVDAVDENGIEGRAAHQAPEVDGCTMLTTGSPAGGTGTSNAAIDPGRLRPGDLVAATVVDSDGVDLVAVPTSVISRAGRPGSGTEQQ